MKKAWNLIIILLAIALSAGMLTSCNPDTAPDGKSAASKKQMTEAEFRQNSQAIRSLDVIEAYAVVNAAAEARSLSADGLVYTFTDKEEISASEIKAKLTDMADNVSGEEKAFYTALASSLPSTYFTVTVEAGSVVRFTVDADGIRTVSSLDITITIDGRTIEIEKDADEKWIEIDGTFFDNTELEKMLDAAEDAAEAIEEFIENLPSLKLDLRSLIAGNETKVEIPIKDGEATISGSTTFKAADGKLTISFDLSYTEFDDDKADENFHVEGSFSLDLDPKSFTDILNNLKNIADVTIKVNGINVWANAFLAELD
ncbi:MAG: hypothetical protein SPK48_01835 [Bullifex sp.]|nr:hypothetical protein [Spirochaetales bacterium]MDY5776567.1 hypothetical protein [Bullifex sp.]